MYLTSNYYTNRRGTKQAVGLDIYADQLTGDELRTRVTLPLRYFRRGKIFVTDE